MITVILLAEFFADFIIGLFLGFGKLMEFGFEIIMQFLIGDATKLYILFAH